ncbi:MAG: NUDIX domain-containing protein [Bdellovibrionota bacterium]|nr:MAG: NUDIX domain-containing protein [Bdellovibrionota bacterium]
MRDKLRVAAYLVLMKGDQVLLLQRHNTGWEDGNFSLVSGHVEFEECPTDAIVREALEESAIRVQADKLECVQVVHRWCHPELVYIDYFFRTRQWSGEPTIQEPDKCSALEWHSILELPENSIEYVKVILTRVHQGKYGLFEYGWRT